LIYVAKLGKTVGLNGWLKLYIDTDFPSQFRNNAMFYLQDGKSLTIESLSAKNDKIKFKDFDDIQTAKKLTNKLLYVTKKETIENCPLEDGQFFWFELIGSVVLENKKVLGVVEDIQRFADIDYLYIKTDKKLVTDGFTKSFLSPYNKDYIDKFDKKERCLYVKNMFEIVENS